MAASLGLKVGTAEERYLGGTCVNVGCVPKKLFVYGSHYSEDFSDANSYGWQSGQPSFDWNVLRDNKSKEISRLNGIYRGLLTGQNVDIYESHAKFLDPHHIEVGNTTVRAEKTLIATGSWPYVPDFPGKELAVTSNEMFYLADLPQRAVVVGGGYIAVEFAGILNGFGVETSLIYRREPLLRGFDDDLRDIATHEIANKGVNIVVNTEVKEIDASMGVVEIDQHRGAKRVHLSNDETIETDLVLYATGRNPLTQDLGLDAAQVRTSASGAVEVNGDLQTNQPHIFALGDVIGRMQLTPVAINEAMCFVFNQFAGESREIDYDRIPTAVFSQPNIGTVGPTEKVARERHPNLKVFESFFRPMKHTMTSKQEKTYMKLLVDGDSDLVVAAHMIGPEAGEMIQGIGVAITAGATKRHFDSTIGIHPTAAEEFVTMRTETVR